jgi:Omp85 superfamily domain
VRRSWSRLLSFVTVYAVVAGAPAWALADEPPATKSTTSTGTDAQPTMDVGDLWRLVRHGSSAEGDQPPPKKDIIVAAPSIGSKPSTGLNAGVSGNMAFFQGDPETTRISSLVGGLKVSQKKQTLTGVKLGIFTEGDRWFIQGDNRFWWTSLNTYPLGTDTLATAATNVNYDFFRVYETAYRRAAPDLYIGAGLNINAHARIRAGTSTEANFDQSAYLAYTEKHGFAIDGQTSSGTSVGLLFDSRDNGINPQRGWLANATYRTFFDGFLGGDSTWQELYVDVRTYRKLTRDDRQKLAFWVLGDFVTGGVAPYLDLPAISADGRSARGYGEGRFRGERLMYGEVEYRNTLTRNGLVGFVAFLNTTTVDSQETGEKLFDSSAPGAGFGFRFLLNKRSKTNLCTDYGWGKQGSHGFYLAIQEAF